jgi:hypothetical protein
MGMLLSNFVAVPVLRIVVDDFAVAVVGSVHHPIVVDFTEPHIVALGVSFEDVHGDVWSAQLTDYSSIGAVTNVNCSVLLGSIARQWFSSLECMHMVFEDSHYFVLVKVRHPVEEGVKVALGIAVEGLTY